jgi:hypothetical protein
VHPSYLSADFFSTISDYKIFEHSDIELLTDLNKVGIKVLYAKSDLIQHIKFDQFVDLKVLICGNSDKNFMEFPQINPSIKLVLCQNSAISDDTIKTLPIGIENKRNGRFNPKKEFDYSFSNLTFHDEVLVPPMSDTNPIRESLISNTINIGKPFHVITNYMTERQYFNLLQKYNFILCLEGNGFDTHRIWETLYMSKFPVVLRTSWAATLEEFNLPILYFENLEEITSEKLYEFWNSHRNFKAERCEVLWQEYWRQYINQASLGI